MDLTTLARVKLLAGSQWIAASDTSLDSRISQVISSVSVEWERSTGRHATDARRTEQYAIKRFSKAVRLRGYPVTDVTTLKYASKRDFSSISAKTSSQYYVDTTAGIVHLLFPTELSPSIVEINYQGGMAADTDTFVTAWPDIADAVGLEVINRVNRSARPEGEIEYSGVGLKHNTQLARLAQFQRSIDANRVAYMGVGA